MNLDTARGRSPSSPTSPQQPEPRPIVTASVDAAYWYSRGMQDERERAACALHELKLFWGRSAGEIYRDRHRERMREMHRAAVQFHQRELGRPYVEHRGGPVSWPAVAA